MKIGLFLGSFNPLHIGHLVVANFIKNETDLDNVLFIVTPQNPDKVSHNMVNENIRYNLVKKCLVNINKFDVSDIEFSMEKPNYTYLTLRKLRENNPTDEFSLIVGGDNYLNFDEWHECGEILKNHRLIVCPRNNDSGTVIHRMTHILKLKHLCKKIDVIDTIPNIGISSTIIREMIKEEKPIDWLVPDCILEDVKEIYGK